MACCRTPREKTKERKKANGMGLYYHCVLFYLNSKENLHCGVTGIILVGKMGQSGRFGAKLSKK